MSGNEDSQRPGGACCRWPEFLFVTPAASTAARHIVGQVAIEALGLEGMQITIFRALNADDGAFLDEVDGGHLDSTTRDVFEGQPQFSPSFLKFDSALLQSHHASATTETRAGVGKPLRDNLVNAHFSRP